ncbi:hypothetical protein [Aquibacillus saliphilus]|uniref:hypothetical protein n=1 Tax=Aquibacillus saliphilus TaxID=1909422 RepID=UPI001CF06DBC|nr:hypothetical protein [Aquibacillus saliphilus]
MPDFENHEQAREWFKGEFQNRFSLRGSHEVDGKRVFYYHLIKQPEKYNRYMESFAKPVKHEITNFDTFESYSTVEISDDGDVSFTI